MKWVCKCWLELYILHLFLVKSCKSSLYYTSDFTYTILECVWGASLLILLMLQGSTFWYFPRRIKTRENESF